MLDILTDDNLRNNNFDEAHTGDKHRQEAVFDKGAIAFDLPKGSRAKSQIANDLSRHRWFTPRPDQQSERELIRKAKSGDDAAKQKLLEANHRCVLRLVGQYSGPPHADMMAAGLLGLCEAITRFNENHGCQLSTYAEHWIRKRVLLAIDDWRREGAAGETRQDRHIFNNPTATAEQVVAAVGGTLANAEKAITRLDAGHDSYDTAEALYDEDDNYKGPKTATSHEICLMYGRFSRFQLAPQLRLHEPASRWIDELANYHAAERCRRLSEVGRPRYALELLERERIKTAHRSKQSRHLYRTETDIKDRARIAARMDVLAFAGPLALVCKLPARSTVQQYELDALIIREKMARLKALRLAQPPKQSKPKRKKWPVTQATTRLGNSSASRSLPTSPMPHVEFAKKILVNLTFVPNRIVPRFEGAGIFQ